MFRVETTRSIDKELISKSNIPFAEMIIESLKSIGFINMQKQGNKISFKSYSKDTNLESFQRRYGNGYLNFETAENNASISIVTENTAYLIGSILGNGFVLLAANYQFIFKSKVSISFILVFNTILILFNVFGIWKTKRRYRTKHLGLLDLIEKKLKNGIWDSE
jgi:hypothetical protein